jgi:hypothetical protein
MRLASGRARQPGDLRANWAGLSATGLGGCPFLVAGIVQMVGRERVQAGDHGGDLAGLGPVPGGRAQPQACDRPAMAKIGSYSRLGSIGRPDRRGRATGPGERFVGQHHDLAPDLVLREGCGGQVPQSGALTNPTALEEIATNLPRPLLGWLRCPGPSPLTSKPARRQRRSRQASERSLRCREAGFRGR